MAWHHQGKQGCMPNLLIVGNEFGVRVTEPTVALFEP